MEIKKTKEADLEGKRVTAFLLGMIAVLAIFFVALEYNSGGKGDEDNIDLDDLAHDIEMIPITRQEKENIVAMEKADAKYEVPIISDKSETTSKLEELSVGDEGKASDELLEINEETEDKEREETKIETINPLKLRVVEDLPQFPGGAVELMKWLTKTLRYPPQAQKAKIEGKVVVQFIVDTDGTICDLKLVNAVNTYLDREAMRVMRLMPKWTPGLQDGKPCRTMVCIPIVFHL